MSYQPIDRSKVVNYLVLHDDLLVAPAELFHAYAKALPDKDEWGGQYAWQNTCGTITFDAGYIEYRKEIYHHGDSDCFTLTLPMSALYERSFIPQEVRNWEEMKAKKLDETRRLETERIIKEERKELILYETLKKKYEGL